jgi:hypothetical protein
MQRPVCFQKWWHSGKTLDLKSETGRLGGGGYLALSLSGLNDILMFHVVLVSISK